MILPNITPEKIREIDSRWEARQFDEKWKNKGYSFVVYHICRLSECTDPMGVLWCNRFYNELSDIKAKRMVQEYLNQQR